jgi:hypothetical protein
MQIASARIGMRRVLIVSPIYPFRWVLTRVCKEPSYLSNQRTLFELLIGTRYYVVVLLIWLQLSFLRLIISFYVSTMDFVPSQNL